MGGEREGRGCSPGWGGVCSEALPPPEVSSKGTGRHGHQGQRRAGAAVGGVGAHHGARWQLRLRSGEPTPQLRDGVGSAAESSFRSGPSPPFTAETVTQGSHASCPVTPNRPETRENPTAEAPGHDLRRTGDRRTGAQRHPHAVSTQALEAAPRALHKVTQQAKVTQRVKVTQNIQGHTAGQGHTVFKGTQHARGHMMWPGLQS